MAVIPIHEKKFVYCNMNIRTVCFIVSIIALLSCGSRHTPAAPVKITVAHTFLSGSWDHIGDEKPGFLSQFTDSGQMRTYVSGRLLENVWFRIDSSAWGKILIISDLPVAKNAKDSLGLSLRLDFLLLRTYGNDTVALQKPRYDYARKKAEGWNDSIPPVSIMKRRKN